MKLINSSVQLSTSALTTRVSSTGGGGELPPPPKKKKFDNIYSGIMFFRALVIDTQKWAQKLCMLHTHAIDLCTQSSLPNKKS